MADENAVPPRLTDFLFFRTEMVQANWRTRIGVIRPDGSDEGYPDSGLPEQVHLVLGYVSPDGRQAELNSPVSGKNWRYDVTTRTAQEIAQPRGEVLPGGTRFLRNENVRITSAATTTRSWPRAARRSAYSSRRRASSPRSCRTNRPPGTCA